MQAGRMPLHNTPSAALQLAMACQNPRLASKNGIDGLPVELLDIKHGKRFQHEDFFDLAVVSFFIKHLIEKCRCIV